MTSRVERTAGELRQAIAQGAFPQNERMPGERDLAARFAVSRTTLRKAVETLIGEGLLEARHGLGTFLRDANPAKAKGQQVQRPSSLLETMLGGDQAVAFEEKSSGLSLASPDEAMAFSPGNTARVSRTVRVWRDAEERPLVIETVAQPFEGDGSPIESAQRRCRALALDRKSIEWLALPQKTTGILIEERAFGGDGRCVRYTRLIMTVENFDIAFRVELTLKSDQP